MSWIIDPFIFSYLQFNHQAYLSPSSQQAENISILNKIIFADFQTNWVFLQLMVFSFYVWPLSFSLLFYFYSLKTLNMILFFSFLLLLSGFHRYFVLISSHRFDRQVNNRLSTPSTLIIRPYTLLTATYDEFIFLCMPDLSYSTENFFLWVIIWLLIISNIFLDLWTCKRIE